jgi:hypothetical protein
MDRRLIPPTFPNPPAEYDQRFMLDLVRSLNDLVTQLRAPGLGRNTTTTLTNTVESPTGLEPGTVWNFDGFAMLAGLGPALPLSPSVYGQVSKMGDDTITITTQDVYVSTGVLGVLDSVAEGIALGTTDTFAVKNVSGHTRRVAIFGSIDAKTNAGNQLLGLRMALNGTTIPATECRANQASAGLEAKLVTRWILELAPDDEVALFVANHTSTQDITFKRGRIVVA